MKLLSSSSLVVAMLCGPALADTAVPAGPGAQALDVTMVVATGKQPRRYVIKLVEDSCGEVSSKTVGKFEDTLEESIRMCATEGAQLKLTIDWKTRDGLREFAFKSTVVTRRGAPVEFEGAGAKLTLTVK